MKKLFAVLLAALFALNTVSCSGTKGDSEDTQNSVGSGTSVQIDDISEPQSYDYLSAIGKLCVWEDTVYYIESGIIKCRDIHDTESEGTVIYDGTGVGGLFENILSTFVLVDELATARNNNAPVLIIAVNCHYTSSDASEGKIISFDAETAQWNIIQDDIAGTIINFSLYGDMIFYNTIDMNSSDGYVNKVLRDGSGHTSIWYDATSRLMIETVHDNVVYISEIEIDSGVVTLYKYGTDFKDSEQIFDVEGDGISVSNVEYVTDDYIYCRCKNNAFNGDTGLYRYDAGDLTKCETILEKAYLGFVYGDMYIYRLEPNANILYAYNFNTGANNKIYDASGIEGDVTISVWGYSDQYVICNVVIMTEFVEDENGEFQFNTVDYVVGIDIAIGESWKLPI